MICKNTLSALVFVLFFITPGISQTAVEVHGQLSISGTHIIDQHGDPVQLQGMSLFWSNWSTNGGPEGNFYTHGAVAETYNHWCSNVVRAAMGIEPNGAYLDNPAAQKAKVETIINAAIDLGMYVIIDWHDHNAHDHEAEAIAFFSDMAETYGEYPNIIYEIYNEPLNVSWSDIIKPYSEAVITAIREHDANNIIVCGTRTWSQRIDEAAADPITGFNNIAYTLHYYAGTHDQWLRDRAADAINDGLPIFVTEYGTVEASGQGDIDQTEAQLWYDFMEEHKISHCNWSLHDKVEGPDDVPGASALVAGASNQGGWTDSDLTPSGLFVKNYLTSNCPDYLTSIENGLVNAPVTIYPNPTVDAAYAKGLEGPWTLHTILGTQVLAGTGNHIDLSPFPPGIYLLRTATGATARIVKE